MRRIPDKYRRVVRVAGVFLLLVVGIVVLLTAIIDSETIRAKILTAASRAVEGELTCRTIQLSLLPRPSVTFHMTKLAIPGKLEGTVVSVTARPKILPLITGRLSLAVLALDSPDFRAVLPLAPGDIPQEHGKFSRAVFEEHMASIIGRMSGRVPGLVLTVHDGRLLLSDGEKTVHHFEKIEGRVALPPGTLDIGLSCTSDLWDTLQLQFSASDDDPAGSGSRLELKGRHMEIEALRRAFLFAAGKNETVRDVWDIVRTGTIEDVTVKSSGKTAAELAHMANITAKGSLHSGRIIIPGIDLTLDAVKADIKYSDGVLEGTDIDARWNTVAGHGGSLRLGLAEESIPIHFEINAAAELPALSVLGHFSDDDRVKQEMKAICAAGGYAAGRLAIDGMIPDVAVTFALADLSLAGGYARFPFPVKITGGQYFYTSKTLGVKHLKGTIGQSSFTDFSADIDLGDHHALAIRSGSIDLSVDEIYPWLTSFEQVKEVAKGLSTARGGVALSSLSVRGPLIKPAAWTFEASGRVRNIVCEGPAVQGAVTLERARFTVNEKTLAFTDARIKKLDATLDASGTLSEYIKGLKGGDVALQGSIGTKAMRSIWEMSNIPREFIVGTPLTLSSLALAWKRGDAVKVSAVGMIAKGPRVALDLVKKPHDLHISKFSINDNESDVAGSLRINAGIFDLAFDGTLVHTTMKKLLPEFEYGSGGIRGKFKTAIVKAEPSHSKTEGALQVDHIQPIRGVPVALNIERLHLHSVKNNLVLDSAQITMDGRRYSAGGTIGLSGDVFDLDLNITSDGIEWSTIEKFMARQADTHSPKSVDFVNMPIRGTVSLRSDFFRWGGYAWYPMNADVRFGDKRIDIDIKDAVLCGISTPGHVTVTPQTVTINFETVPREKNLEPFSTCISKGTSTITGTFEFQGAFKTAGFKRDFKDVGVMKVLTDNLSGTFELAARKVRIIRDATFSGLLAYLDGTEHFDEALSDIKKEGLTFLGMKLKAELVGGVLRIHEATYEGEQIEIAGTGEVNLVNHNLDLKLLVAPLKRVDAVVKKIPAVGYILGGSLISIPIVITGTMDDPRVSKMSPAEVGASLLGIMKRTLNLPVRVIEPVMKYPKNYRDGQPEN